jgi:hypothetical protein
MTDSEPRPFPQSKSVAVGKAARNDADTATAAFRLLAIVALLVAIVPVSTYFVTVKYIFGGASVCIM